MFFSVDGCVFSVTLFVTCIINSKTVFMGWLYVILVGLAAGFIAGLIMRGKGFGFLVNMLVGIAGAIIGKWLFGQLGIHLSDGMVGSLVTAVVGAVLLLWIVSLFRKKT